jgi:hypothetical protein
MNISLTRDESKRFEGYALARDPQTANTVLFHSVLSVKGA